MNEGVLVLRIEDLVSLGAFLVQMACVIGTLAIWGGRIDARLRAVEGHTDAVQKIGPMEARFEQFERGMESRLENIERAVREAASAVQSLAIATSTRRNA